MRCSGNDESVLKRVGKFGGVLRVMLLRENDNELNHEETDGRDELNEEL